MPVTAFSALATGTTVSVIVTPNKSGVTWVVPQFGVKSLPFRSTVSVTVTHNGLYVTSASVLPVSAAGAPAITLQYFDVLSFDFAGMVAGDDAIVTLMYNEAPWGYPLRSDVV